MIDVMQGPVKDPGGQVFSVMDVAGPVVDVVKNPLNILFIQYAECIIISLNCPVEVYTFVGVGQSIISVGGSSMKKNPYQIEKLL